MFHRFALLLCFISFFKHQCAANFTCYTCQYSENEFQVGYECVNAPENYNRGPPTGHCDTPCHTLRQVSLGTGSVYYMWRGCQSEPSPEDGCTSDIYYEYCRWTCSGDLCNDDDMTPPTTPPPTSGPSTATPELVITTASAAYNTCYTCQYSENGNLIGYECVDAPEDYDLGPATGRCTTPCHTLRQVTSTGSVYYMWRGCQPEPSPEDGCTTDIYYEYCRWTCFGNLCNGEDMSPPTQEATSSAVSSLSCYSCSYSYSVGADDRCVTNPANVATTNNARCSPDEACVTFRQWDKGENMVRSFHRGCELQDGHVDNCVEDTDSITCNTYCQSELCNVGDGIPEIRSAPKHAANRK